MKLKFVIGFLILTAAVSSCGLNNTEDSASKEQLIGRIKEMEDSLKGLQANLGETKKIPNLTHFELINRLLDYYHAYPEDPYSAECLDKVHMKYSGLGIHQRAVEYADTLLEKFPDYPNRAMILESQGSSYDIFIQPRNVAKVKYYYELLLKENLNLDKEKKADLQERLKHIDMTFDEYIDYRINALAGK